MPGGAAAASAKARKEHTKDHHHHDPHHGEQKKPTQEEETTVLNDADIYVGWRRYQPQAKKIYNHIFVQVSVAFLIGANFIVNIIQAQIDPDGTKHEAGFGVFELFFNVAFLIELVVNMYAFWLCEFWRSGWNIFDFNVVLIGWMFQLQVPLPGPMKLLRMMRAFRVFRLFKRVASLRKILNSLAKAIPGVMNAFLIQLIVMCIYAIIGVDRFQDYGEGGSFTNEHGKEIALSTGRDQDYGFEYFGDFGKSLFTMFQVLTGESWSEVICRPLFHSNNPTTSMGAAFFFVSFVILNAVVLINVVVAVLLEKMVDETPPPGGDNFEPMVNPVEESLNTTVTEVAELRNQMDHLVQVSAVLQKQLADVSGVKEQLDVLLSHNGIKVDYGLAAAARGDDPNGFHSPQPPETPVSPLHAGRPVDEPETLKMSDATLPAEDPLGATVPADDPLGEYERLKNE